MQTSFREEKRQEAEMEHLEAQRRINELELEHNYKHAAQQADIKTKSLDMTHQHERKALQLELEKTNLKVRNRLEFC